MDWVIALKVGLFIASLLVLILVMVHFSVKKPPKPRAMNLPKYEKRVIIGRPQPAERPIDTGGGPTLQRFQPDHPERDITPISPFSSENTQENTKNDENSLQN